MAVGPTQANNTAYCVDKYTFNPFFFFNSSNLPHHKKFGGQHFFLHLLAILLHYNQKFESCFVLFFLIGTRRSIISTFYNAITKIISFREYRGNDFLKQQVVGRRVHSTNISEFHYWGFWNRLRVRVERNEKFIIINLN